VNRRDPLVATAGSIGAVLVATGLLYALRPIAPTLSLGVLYIPAVLATSVLFGLLYAIAAAVASMLAFNFLFLPPVHTLTLADGRNWTALVVYVLTAVVASDLERRARRRAAEAVQREHEAELLSDAAAALLRDEPLDEIRERAERVLERADAHARRRFEAAVGALLGLAEGRRGAEALRRSDAIKTVVLQTVSHDFRTPLATMRAAVGALEDGSLQLSAADREDLLETIRLETDRLSRLVENVLDVSRLQAGAAAPHPAVWDVDDLLAQSVAEVSDPDRVRVDTSSDLPAAFVDAVQIQRALVNLIENALKFSRDPVDVRAFGSDGEVVVDVLDRGPGIGAEPSKTGLGLGLSIARGFAEANDGALELSPRGDGGTRARVTMPAHALPTGVPQ
jgi:two-component system, OmpR family, sensor histidine kinase KdpD